MPRFAPCRDASATCPACTAVGLEHFYQVDGVPTSSNLLMSSRDEAINWPRGDLRLAFCPACGFITNTAFDPSTQQLTARYEATQACSPTFGKFARQLAQDWIDRYSLRGKKLLEIGCGQGEFIAMLCEMAEASGWGIDPIVEPSRTPKTDRVEFIADKYGPKFWLLKSDFAVCRHTLEHIKDVAAFLSEVMHGIALNPEAVLAIEVPDNERVFKEAAFWDLYYEHCSYFDAPSLRNALAVAGLQVIRTRLEFGGQYLIAESTPSAHGPRVDVDRPAGIVDQIEHFRIAVASKIETWNRMLATASGNDVVAWGSGSKAVGFLTTLAIDQQVAAVVDINPAKHGTFLPGSGHEIIAPDKLRAIRPKTVIVMNPIYLEEIRRLLRELRLAPELIALQ